jgi:hypothetical protein
MDIRKINRQSNKKAMAASKEKDRNYKLPKKAALIVIRSSWSSHLIKIIQKRGS